MCTPPGASGTVVPGEPGAAISPGGFVEVVPVAGVGAGVVAGPTAAEVMPTGFGVGAGVTAPASGGVGDVVVPSGGDANPVTSKTTSLLAA